MTAPITPKISEVLIKRREICGTCEFKKSVGVDLCSKCGCIIEGKIRLKGSKCPINKWTSI
jgi:hypothetical protein